MRNFREIQEQIVEYIKDNLPSFYDEQPEIILDFLDFDKYKHNFSLFVDFSNIQFSTSQFTDDCENIIKLNMTVFLVFRNDTIKNLQDKMLDCSYGFYRMIKKNPAFGVAYNSTLNGIDFYKYAEANRFLVCSEFSLMFEIAA